MESRPRDGGVCRRRKCAAGHLSYTMECQAEAPRKKKPKKPKPSAKRKREQQVPYSPALKEWNLEVTADSPLWLRSMALKLG